MAITRTKFVKKGAWRTLESGWNAKFWVSFYNPNGAQVKVRYGGGWPVGWDSQRQTLNGETTKWVIVSGSSILYARVQVYVQQDIDITYGYHPGSFDGFPQ